ncbi:MAG: IS66 family transposase [Gammaproteobacteria bacterium]|nr:IS66 family transposase [Gammaproteobacteria bacterium]
MDIASPDPAELQELLVAERAGHAATRQELEAEVARHRQTALERDEARGRLQALLKRYFGRSSEKLDPNQLSLAWAAVQDELMAATPPAELPAPPPRPTCAPAPRRARRLEDLPVLETVVIDVPAEQKVAADGTALVRIREEVTDEVDYQPGKLFRRQIIRPVYASPSHAGAPQIAPLPPRVIPGGQAGPGLIAQVLLSKYADHLPLYRQEAMLSRLGPAFTRQAMGEWVGHAAGLLRPVYDELRQRVGSSGYVQADETPIRVLDPARPGAAREAWLWTFLAPVAKAVVFDFRLTRSHEPALAFLREFRGAFQTDGYLAYDKALDVLPPQIRAGIVHFNCLAHCRRAFVEALASGDDRAAPFLAQIGALYHIESELREATPQARAQARSTRSLPWLAAMELALKKASLDLSILPRSALSKAVGYALARWPNLTRFAEPAYGQVHIDSNAVENSIRPTAIGRKNYLFVGHPGAGGRSAVIYSILGTCKLLGLNPWHYLTWALPRLAAATNHTAHRFTPQLFAKESG